ncbi:hypothetical protein MHZ36_04350 [Staphylococcus sp. ACRSN]|uniref:hypothetical protein n=1 Tax=Staphylococcus sp. ACRSN TaxID=2918214 RepID=UPI001EF39308|nr:hypothetical protein [Staphylococcus sp. ACRSN]MCG7338511.1 hypothetical protein [Staphylococcus sp. ACRSN]
MFKFISWIPYILILSFGFCYTLGLIAGLAVSIIIGTMIGITVDYDKKRKKQKQLLNNR